MPDNLTLNIASMDERHDSFLELLAKLQSCGNAEFLPLFKEMVERTRKHFAFKEEMMHTYNFYARSKSCSDVRGRTGNAFTLTTNPLFLESGMAAFLLHQQVRHKEPPCRNYTSRRLTVTTISPPSTPSTMREASVLPPCR
jgi:hypothetical protein